MSIFRNDVLAGQVAIVTGGGTGICKGITRGLLAHGASVCITSRKQEVIDATAAELEAETGGKVLAVSSDVRDPEAAQRVVAATVEKFGRLDILVNGAAGNFLAPAAALSPNGFKTVVDIDLNGTFHFCKAAFDELCKAGKDKGACIINITATLHYHGTPMQLHASAAKAGVDALTKNLAVEWGQFGVRVNSIAPGPIGDTEGMKRLAPGGMKEKVLSMVPMGRFGRSDEIANMAVFLASEAGEWISGQVMVVDGGNSVVQQTILG